MEDHHIQKLSEHIDTETYMRLGTELGIAYNKLESIKTDNRQITMVALTMLRAWYMNCEDPVTAMEELVNALKRAELTILVRLILKK